MYFDPSGHTRVTVTLPNGSTQTANVNSSGHTIMNNGSRPPAGSTVTFPNGNTYSVVSNPSGAGGVSGVRLPSSSGSSGSGSSGGSSGGSGGGLGGVNFGPNQGADWLRTGSGLSFEAFWGVTPFGMAFSNQATSTSMVRPPSGGTNMPTVQGISSQQAQSNIQSAFNAFQGGFISFTQFSDNVALNLSMTGLSGDALHLAMSFVTGSKNSNEMMASMSLFDVVFGHGSAITFTIPERVHAMQDQPNVMLSYIVAKNSGEIIRTDARERNRTITSFTVTMGEHTQTYVVGHGVSIVNGQVIINRGALMYDFGLTIQQASHNPGDRFTTKESAVMAFALMYHPLSMRERQEYSASIDRMFDGSFTFANIMNSAMHAGRPLENLTMRQRNTVGVTFNENTVGIIHTHWNPTGSLRFTDGDMNLARTHLRAGTYTGDWFLVNRNGRVRYITPNARNTNFEREATLFRNIR